MQMVEQTAKTALRNTWESAAPGWAKWEAAFSRGLADVTDTMITMPELEPDLACLISPAAKS